MNTQDFTRGVDFTAINPATGGDHNNLIELAVPEADTGAEVGKGLPITTTDSALNTPVVPDAATNTKWKRYPWFRRPHASATDTKGKSYIWNDSAVNNSTYLKWVEVTADLSDLTALANNALSTAESAVATAEVANTTANTANTAATAATATANTAQTAATTAQASADAATVTANAANTNANTALTLANVVENQVLILQKDYVKISFRGNGYNVTANQWTKLSLNTTNNDASGLSSLTSNTILLAAGTYRVRAWMHGDNFSKSALMLGDDDNKLTLLTGNVHQENSNGSRQWAYVTGIITLAVATNISLYFYSVNASPASVGTTGANAGINSATGLPAGYAAVAVPEEITGIEFIHVF